MFTIADFERARRSKKTDSIMDAILFSMQKNEFAYAMNLCDSHDRGTYAENLVGDKLIDCGFKVDFFGKTEDYDLLINGNIRAEVKLGTIQSAGRNKTKYTFHKIKPELFDTIFLVFLNPHGATIKWTTDEMMNEWSVDYTRGKHGYSITFNGDMQAKKLVYDESIDSFIRLYR
jgi:hypothetical protein